ncbi:MAG: hypothetical protein M1824_001921 [Vezdaea acicularis]|nr:MAG: hypothetical protein M1824_001921 [Vezdaea acicularis]
MSKSPLARAIARVPAYHDTAASQGRRTLTFSSRCYLTISRPQYAGTRRLSTFPINSLNRSRTSSELRRLRLPPSRRYQGTWARLSDTYRAHPFAGSVALFAILAGAGAILYGTYIYQRFIVSSFSAYPEPVAKKLRRAIYYTNISLEPREALKYYKQALDAAETCGMDCFSDEVLGIKVAMAWLMEKIPLPAKAIEVLLAVEKDCRAYVSRLDAAGQKEDGSESLLGTGEEGKEEEQGTNRERERKRILKWTVRMNVKLGELYSSPHIAQPELAEQRLVWAVEAILRERTRSSPPRTPPTPPLEPSITTQQPHNDIDFFSNEEVGGSLEALATHYMATEQYRLAAPLYIGCLQFASPRSCRAVGLLQNVAAAYIAELIRMGYPPKPIHEGSTELESTDSDDTADAAQLLRGAEAWLAKSQEVEEALPREERTPECDVCRMARLQYRGAAAEAWGRLEEARASYEDALKGLRELGGGEGVEVMVESLERVGKKIEGTWKKAGRAVEGEGVE